MRRWLVPSVATATATAAGLLAMLDGGSAVAQTVQHSAAGTASPVVVTDRGPVRGTVAADHRSFQGIPYATADRFTSPRPAPAWTTPKVADDQDGDRRPAR